ncbi:MAG: TetR family transcriptional regulator [Rhodoglobus sp.]
MVKKKERTRERLTVAAFELFAEQGYESTTVAQIAERAGVSEMTFFRYFPAKENVLIDDPYDPLIAAAVSEQSSNCDPLTRVVRGIRQAWHGLPITDTREVRERLRIAATSPALRASMLRNNALTEDAIVAALTDVDATTARIAAVAALGALTAALLEWSTTDDGELGAAIDSALDVLEVRRG